MSTYVQQKEQKKSGLFEKFLNLVEVGGNKLPHPVAMFFGFFIISLVLSKVLAMLGVSVTYQEIAAGKGVIEKTTTVRDMLTTDGMRLVLTSVVKNFTGHAALGSIVVAMLGVGLAEGSGLMLILYEGRSAERGAGDLRPRPV